MSVDLSRRRFVRTAAALVALSSLPVSSSSAKAALPSRPLILVHGFADQVWIWRRPDNPIVARLLQSGYRWDNGSLLTFHYPAVASFPEFADSQGDLAAAAALLASFVRAAAADSPDGQIDLLGFSMGGLVARAAVSQLRDSHSNGQALIHSLLMIASPNNGADLLNLIHHLSAGPHDILTDLVRELLGVDLEGTAAQQMLPGSDFLNALNDADRIDHRLRYLTVAGAARLQLRAGPVKRSVGVGDGVMSSESASYLPGAYGRTYALPELLGEGETPMTALRRSEVFHPRLMFNDNVALIAAAELAPTASDVQELLDSKLDAGVVKRDVRD